MTDSDNVIPLRLAKAPPCPICGKAAMSEARPFCSKRCADIDLGRWFGGTYRIPTDDPPDGDESDPGR